MEKTIEELKAEIIILKNSIHSLTTDLTTQMRIVEELRKELAKKETV